MSNLKNIGIVILNSLSFINTGLCPKALKKGTLARQRLAKWRLPIDDKVIYDLACFRLGSLYFSEFKGKKYKTCITWYFYVVRFNNCALKVACKHLEEVTRTRGRVLIKLNSLTMRWRVRCSIRTTTEILWLEKN